MVVSPHNLRTSIKLATVAIAALFALSAIIFPASAGNAVGFLVTSEPTPTPKPAAKPTPKPAAVKPKPKYSEFKHDVKAHQMDCSKCHSFPSSNWEKVRKDDAFPDITDYPKHASCINCHRQQFFRGSKPVICSICHTNPGPRNSERHPFPNPREIFDESPKGKTAATSDFQVAFPHDKHIEIVSRNAVQESVIINASWTRSRRAFAEESCAVCHKTLAPQGDSPDEYFTKPAADVGDAFWLKKGTFKTSPTGHATCFTCHSADSGMSPAPTDCATCHKPRQSAGPADFDAAMALKMGVTSRAMLEIWKSRSSSGTFRHEFSSHSEMACATCHNVTAMKTEDPKTTKVPVTSCNMCHITATVDDGGVLNFEVEQRKTNPAFQCVKCHITFGKEPVPASHLNAIVEAGK